MYCSQRGEDDKYRKTNETKEDISILQLERRRMQRQGNRWHERRNILVVREEKKPKGGDMEKEIKVEIGNIYKYLK